MIQDFSQNQQITLQHKNIIDYHYLIKLYI